MKKILSLTLVLSMLLAFTSCGSDSNAPSKPSENPNRGSITVYVDGKSKKTLSFDAISGEFDGKNIADTYYYGVAMTDLCTAAGIDSASLKAAYIEASDGYMSYISGLDNIFVAGFASDKNGVYASYTDKKDKAAYSVIDAKGNVSKYVKTIYLLTAPSDFSVEVTKNGKAWKTVTIGDFMKKVTLGDGTSASPKMTELSHFYNYGKDVFKGSFLALSSDAFLAQLGITYHEGDQLLIYDASGKNSIEVSQDKGAQKSVWNLYYYVMVDGNTVHDTATPSTIGLSCLTDGTGMRWMTQNISKIDWVTASA